MVILLFCCCFHQLNLLVSPLQPKQAVAEDQKLCKLWPHHLPQVSETCPYSLQNFLLFCKTFSPPGWSCPMRGARRGWGAGLTGNKLSSKTLSEDSFSTKTEVFLLNENIRLLLRGRSHNQLTVQGRPKSPTNSGEEQMDEKQL